MGSDFSNLSKFSDAPALDVAVIGAGISAAAAATFLARAGRKASVFEKSRSYGGRCASRLWNQCVVDHGAQYITFTDESFLQRARMASNGRLLALTAPVLDCDGTALFEKNGKRWYHAEGNNRLAKDLFAADLMLERVHREHTAIAIEQAGENWRVVFEGGGEAIARAVVVTAPWPQAARLLGMPEGAPAFEPCLTAFFAYETDPGPSAVQAYGRFVNDGEGIAWTACENHKAGRIPAGMTVFVAQASADFSARHFEDPPETWTPILRDIIEASWEVPAGHRKAEGIFSHRWKFARKIGAPMFRPELPTGLFLAGDSFAGARVEAAWFSGITAARQVLQSFPDV